MSREKNFQDMLEEELDCMDLNQICKLGRRSEQVKKSKKAAKVDRDN